MRDFDRGNVTLSRPNGRRSWFGELGDRLAGTLSSQDQIQTPGDSGGADRWVDETPEPWEESTPRFPVARHGYECRAVDEHVSELEQELLELDRELAELRSQARSPGEVTTELQRVGEQTSSILVAAHEQARQTTRLAEEEAERCIADAAANALAITSKAKHQLHELERERNFLSHERERLIADIRTVSGALSSLADDAEQRFSPDPANASSPSAT